MKLFRKAGTPWLALAVLSLALGACGRRDADHASNAGAPEAARSATASADSGRGSSGANGGSSGASGGDSSSRAADDSVITTKAKTALLADTTVKGTDIKVETDKGTVVLSGTVEDRKQMQRAASIVRGIDGVKSVENKLTVEK